MGYTRQKSDKCSFSFWHHVGCKLLLGACLHVLHRSLLGTDDMGMDKNKLTVGHRIQHGGRDDQALQHRQSKGSLRAKDTAQDIGVQPTNFCGKRGSI